MTAKPQLSLDDVARLASDALNQVIVLTPIHEGLQSQSYRTTLADGPAVLRVSYSLRGFEKDRYAAEHFAGPGLPIPRVLSLGWLDSTHAFCVSELAPGEIVQDLPAAVSRRLAIETFACWRAIQAVEVAASAGYGEFDGTGQAPFESWQAYLLSAADLDWSGLDVDQALVEGLRDGLRNLAAVCPNEQRLIHCDFGADNLLTDGERITAVLDWEQAAYGDPLYDLATAHFWGPGHGCLKDFANYGNRQCSRLPGYTSRLACYQTHQCLLNIHYFASTGRERGLNFVIRRGRELLAAHKP